MRERTLIAGLGSDFGDDQAGWIITRRLQKTSSCVDIHLLRSPAGLLDILGGIDVLHIVDACRGGGYAGSILCFHWPTPMLSALSFAGTHDMDLSATLCLAEELRLLPKLVKIWGIEGSPSNGGGDFAGPLAPAVHAAVDQLVARLGSECRLEVADRA